MEKVSNKHQPATDVYTMLAAGWISTKHKMPEKMQFVLFCEYNDFGSFRGELQTFHIGWFDEIGQWFSECTGWMDNKTITHWMKLPSPPACG